MLKFKKPITENVLIDALQLIARDTHDDLSADPLQWSSTIAYFALGGRIENGQRLDSVENLIKDLGYSYEN